MATEPTDLSLGVSPSQGPQVSDPWSQLNNKTGNSTTWAEDEKPFANFHNIFFLVGALICLCGAVGNGAVVWLLGFRLKRSPYSVYILNLACADGTFLLSTGVSSTISLLHLGTWEMNVVESTVKITSILAELGLLMAVSTERCVSVLWPLWYRCRRPVHLSCAVCTLVWGLSLCAGVYEGLCDTVVDMPCNSKDLFYVAMVVTTFLVLCVSSLTLLVRVQCGSRGTRPSRLYVSILLTVLAFLLLALPHTVYFLVFIVLSRDAEIPGLLYVSFLLFLLNCTVNPIIYFFVGRYRQRPGRTSLQEVLQRALSDEEGAELSGTQLSTDTTMSPELRGGSSLGTPRSELDKVPQQGCLSGSRVTCCVSSGFL